MCDKLPYNGRRLDQCMIKIIDKINIDGEFKTLACCCGHYKYPPTIVVVCISTNKVFEYYSKIRLADIPRKSKRYYKRDKEGYYYIPEVEERNKKDGIPKVTYRENKDDI